MDRQAKFNLYKNLLIKWQKSINLVSPNTINDIETRHIKDSEQLAHYIPNHVQSITDIGSGAGFPALIIAMMRPDLRVGCIESDERKCTFLKTVSRETSTPITIINDRIENICIENYKTDLITARACASVTDILDMTYRTGSDYLLLKGKTHNDEIHQAQKHYTFKVQTFSSATDSEAKILYLTDVSKIG